MRNVITWLTGIGTLGIVLTCGLPALAQPSAWPGTGGQAGPGWPGLAGAPHRPGTSSVGGPEVPHRPEREAPHHPRRPNAFRPVPQYPYSWFQRPYPYHLDYYRMRYGGSYAPYFGNLYGPPVLLFTPPPIAWPPNVPYGGSAYYW